MISAISYIYNLYGLENGRAYGKDYYSPKDIYATAESYDAFYEREKMKYERTYKEVDSLERKYKNADSLSAFLSDYNVFFNARQAIQAKKENKRINTIK